MGSAFNLGKLFGIQFRLHYTWFVIFILITFSLSWQVFPSSYPDWPQFLYWIMGIATSLLLFASVVAHELAHSLVGRANGISVKSITLFIFGGVAQITREAAKASAELKMAAAGPACSLVIGGLFGLLWLFTKGVIEPVAAMAYWLAYINVVLAIFNLIPGFPMDGGRVFRSLFWRFTGNYKRSTQIATQVGRGIGFLFILAGILIAFLLGDWFGGLWIAFIGWFLQNAASASYRQLQWQGVLQGVTASQVMTPNCPVVSPYVTLEQIVRDYIFTTGHRCFLVNDESKLEGILTLHDIKAVPQQNRDMVKVKEVMTPANKLKVAEPGQDALSVLGQMEESSIDQIPVVSEGRVIGLITRDNVMGLLQIRLKLGI